MWKIKYKKKFWIHEAILGFLIFATLFVFGFLSKIFEQNLSKEMWLVYWLHFFLITSLIMIFYSYSMLKWFRKIGLMDKNKPLLRQKYFWDVRPYDSPITFWTRGLVVGIGLFSIIFFSIFSIIIIKFIQIN